MARCVDVRSFGLTMNLLVKIRTREERGKQEKLNDVTEDENGTWIIEATKNDYFDRIGQ